MNSTINNNVVNLDVNNTNVDKDNNTNVDSKDNNTNVDNFILVNERQPIELNFNGGYNQLLTILHKRVRPIIGVVKYYLPNWELFPNIYDKMKARGLALKWASSLEKRTDFANKSVLIFFHLIMKHIRIEVKEKVIKNTTNYSNMNYSNMNYNMNYPNMIYPNINNNFNDMPSLITPRNI